MPKLVCPKCECEFRPKLNGVGVIETMNFGVDPYKLWRADLWECPGCSMEVVAGFSGQGITPLAEHFQNGFAEELEDLKQAKMIVYDHERPRLKSGERKSIEGG